MKLIQITNRYYFLFTTLLLVIAFLLLFFTLKTFSSKQEKLNLLLRTTQISLQLKKGKEVPNLPPYIEVKEINQKLERDSYELRDTYILNPYENEKELFNELTSYKTIKGKTYKIIVRNALLDADDFYSDVTKDVLLIFVFLLVSLSFMNFFISKKIWHPFYLNLLAIKQFNVRDKKRIEFKKSKIREFKELNIALEQLIKKAQIEYNALKEFTENASHEMQTPLAILKSNIENLLQSIQINKEQADIIQNIEVSINRMAALNKSLFLLAKLDNQQFENNESVDMSGLLTKQINFYSELMSAKNISIETNITSDVFVTGNESLIDTLISNLLNNAIKHNHENGNIKVELIADSLQISNTGEAIEINPELLFQRFKKASSLNNSTGLGLAIVYKICIYFKWHLSYKYLQNKHIIKIDF